MDSYFAEENQSDSNALLSIEKVVSISPIFFWYIPLSSFWKKNIIILYSFWNQINTTNARDLLIKSLKSLQRSPLKRRGKSFSAHSISRCVILLLYSDFFLQKIYEWIFSDNCSPGTAEGLKIWGGGLAVKKYFFDGTGLASYSTKILTCMNLFWQLLFRGEGRWSENIRD